MATVYQTAIELGAKMSAGFKTATTGASRQLADLSAKVTALEKTHQSIASFERLTSEVRRAEETSRKARAEYDRLGKEIESTAKPSRKLKERFREARAETKRADKALARKRTTLKTTGAALRSAGVDTRRLSSEKSRLGREAARAGRKMAAMSMISKSNLGANLSKLGGTIRRLGRTSAIVFGGMAAAIYKLGTSTADQGDSAAKAATRWNMSTDAVQQFRYAAERGEIEVTQFDKSMDNLVTRMGEAANKGGPVEKTLRRLGLRSRDLVKLPTEQWMYKIAEGMDKIKNPAKRAALAGQLVGRRYGTKFASALFNGSENLRKLAKEADATGNVLSYKAVKGAEVFQDRLLDAKMAAQGLKNQIGVALMPVLVKAFKSFSTWAKDNRERIQQWGKTFAKWLEHKAIPAAIELGRGLWKVAKEIGAVVIKIKDAVGGWENFGKIIAMIALSKVAYQVGQVAVSLVQVGRGLVTLATLATGHPIIALMAAIAGAGMLIYKFRKQIGGALGLTPEWDDERTDIRGAKGQVTAATKGMTPKEKEAYHQEQRKARGARMAYRKGGFKGLVETVRDQERPKGPKAANMPISGPVVNYSPNINIKGGTASKDEVKQIVKEERRAFVKMFNKVQKDIERLSFA